MGDVVGLYRRFGVRLPNLGDGWATTRCFTGSHQDRHPSARVHLRSGGFRCFTCGARGGLLDALELLGVRDRDEARRLAADHGILDPPKRPKPPRPPPTPPVVKREEAPPGRVDYDQLENPTSVRDRTWTYVDEHGAPVGRVRRLDLADGSKRIWQERPSGDTWLPGLEGATLPLYQLPLVHAAARQHRHVLVVEGEKAVDALERVGLLATTNAGGAGKWRPEHTTALKGANATAICDSDLPGRLHPTEITSSCLTAGIEASMPLDLHELRNDGADVVDYLAQVAETIRGVNPSLPASDLKTTLRGKLEHELARCLPATPAALQQLIETARYLNDPAGRTLAACPRCGQERPQRVTAGIMFCPCGAHQPAPA